MNNRTELAEFQKRLHIAQIGHYLYTEKYLRINGLIGILLVIFSTFTTAFLIADIEKISAAVAGYLQIKPMLVKALVILLSLSASILAALQTYLRYGEKAEKHRRTATEYGVLRRKIEVALANGISEEKCKDLLLEVERDWKGIVSDAPLTPKKLVDSAYKQYQEETTPND